MTTDDLREAFLAFFESKGCVRRPSDVLVPRRDPSVLFTPAGMNQFKDYFLGVGKKEFTRATTCQKCLRTGDIEQVGQTPYHHTFFEMLGNFSFGDYFKREAIHWAWEFLTCPVDAGGLGLESGKLSASVYLNDDEAYEIWRKEIGLPASRICRDDEYENFWPAGAPSKGPDGVCGPCSEIFYHTPWGEAVEIWNLVFTQFHRVGPPPDNLHPLPQKNIDTGMGLERTASVLQGVRSNFEIDVFRPLVARVEGLVSRVESREPGIGTGPSSLDTGPSALDQLVRIRRISDHVRAVIFCIHENVIPSNEKQGYVVRRLLRRAVLDGYLIGLREPFVHRLVPTVVETMKVPYPELAETAERVTQMIRSEEERFFATLEKGLSYFEAAAKDASINVPLSVATESDSAMPVQPVKVSGEEAFRLHATYGFPIELTEALAAERGGHVDRKGFERLMREHEEVSGTGAFSGEVFKRGPLAQLKETLHGTEFLGYQTTEAPAEIKAIIAGETLVQELQPGAQKAAVVLDHSPFYGEAGGQVGDIGVIESKDGSARFEVQDTHRDDELILHMGRLVSGKLQVGDRVGARVDARRRAGIRRAHSATHLLHYALRKVLGSHAQQAGSKVDDDYLRFDFSHPRAVSPEELREIEEEVNRRILESAAVQWEFMPLDEARRRGAMALFGEKYPDTVRVVSMGDFSKELCGGTHLDNTAQAGLFKIISEESVAAGTRRIVALTGVAALQYVREQEQELAKLSQQLRAPPAELSRRIEAILTENRELKRQLKERRPSDELSPDQLLAEAVEVAGVKIVVRELPGHDAAQMRSCIDLLRRKGGPIATLLVSTSDGNVQLVGGLSRDLVDRGLNASDWVKAVAAILGGGGGGRADLAQAGGKTVEKLPEALEHAVAYIRQRLQHSED